MHALAVGHQFLAPKRPHLLTSSTAHPPGAARLEAWLTQQRWRESHWGHRFIRERGGATSPNGLLSFAGSFRDELRIRSRN